MMARILVWTVVLLILGGATAPLSTWCQEPTPADPAAVPPLSDEELQNRLKQLDQATELDDEAKAKVRQFYTQALEELEAARAWSTKSNQYEQMAATAERDLQAAKEKLQATREAEPPEVPADASLDQLKQLLRAATEDRARAKEALSTLEAEPARRETRRQEIAKFLETQEQQLAELQKQLAAPPPAGEPPEVSQARRAQLQAQREVLEKRTAAVAKEQAAYAATRELLSQQRDLAALEVARSDQLVDRLQKRVDVRRQEEAKELVSSVQPVDDAPPGLAPIAARNIELAETSNLLAQKITAASQSLQNVNQQLEELTRKFERTQAKVDKVGLNQNIGLLLRNHKADLPPISQRRQNINLRQREIHDVQLQLMELEDDRTSLAVINDDDIDETVDDLRDADILPATGQVSDEHRQYIQQRLQERRDLLDKLIPELEAYRDRLFDLDDTERQLITATEAYTHYINERVLWVRSTLTIMPSDFPDALRTAAALFSPAPWRSVVNAWWRDLQEAPLPLITSLLVFLPLLFLQRRLRTEVAELGTLASRGTCLQFSLTLRALLLTFVIAFVWPGLLAYLGWRLSAYYQASSFARSVAHGLLATASLYFPLEFFRQVCRSKGLAEAHFGWPDGVRMVLRRHLRWFVPVSLPLVFIVSTLRMLAQDNQNEQLGHNSFGRLVFIAMMLIIATVVHNVLRPQGPLAREFRIEDPEGWRYRLRHLWYALGTGAPLLLAALAFGGYYYTSIQLAVRLETTAWFLMGLLLLTALLLRWLLVYRRKLAMEQARQRRAAAQAEDLAEEAPALPSMPARGQPVVDLSMLNEQSRRLFRLLLTAAALTGMWWIWIDVLPALGILDEVPIVPGTAEDADPVTLADLALALVTGAVTLVAVRNIPGLMEMLLLQRLPMDAGARYATISITRYVLTIIGVVLAFGVLGIHWSSIQWLVAAATVGLGFGLQEIFANFISGLIVLLERPVRVGDIVTVDNVTGVVSKIHMRATTVINWDQQEFIVPNKDFVTGRLLNWTLSSLMNRVVINVGIAYGSDTEHARSLLLEICEQNSIVLEDPPPIVTFEQFGDSTLNFSIRVYLPNLENRLEAIHQLHSEIHRRFREANIEIAFPQRDLHVRTINGTLTTNFPGTVEPGEDGSGSPTSAARSAKELPSSN